MAPRGPKRPQEAPRRLQEAPKRHPRATQKAPTGSQEYKKGSQEHPKGSQEHQKGTQEHPNGKKCFKAFKYLARFPFLLGKVYKKRSKPFKHKGLGAFFGPIASEQLTLF